MPSSPKRPRGRTSSTTAIRMYIETSLAAGMNSVVIEMDHEGRLKLRCERGVFDVAANLRIYSALVELP